MSSNHPRFTLFVISLGLVLWQLSAFSWDFTVLDECFARWDLGKKIVTENLPTQFPQDNLNESTGCYCVE